MNFSDENIRITDSKVCGKNPFKTYSRQERQNYRHCPLAYVVKRTPLKNKIINHSSKDSGFETSETINICNKSANFHLSNLITNDFVDDNQEDTNQRNHNDTVNQRLICSTPVSKSANASLSHVHDDHTYYRHTDTCNDSFISSQTWNSFAEQGFEDLSTIGNQTYGPMENHDLSESSNFNNNNNNSSHNNDNSEISENSEDCYMGIPFIATLSTLSDHNDTPSSTIDNTSHQFNQTITDALQAVYDEFLIPKQPSLLNHAHLSQLNPFFLAQEFGLLPMAPVCPRHQEHGPMVLTWSRHKGPKSKLMRISIAETSQLFYICSMGDHPRVYQLISHRTIFEDSRVNLSDFFRILMAFVYDFPLEHPSLFDLQCDPKAFRHMIKLLRRIIESCMEHDIAYESKLGQNLTERSSNNALPGTHIQLIDVRINAYVGLLIAVEWPTGRVRTNCVSLVTFTPEVICTFAKENIHPHAHVITPKKRIYEHLNAWGFVNHQQVDFNSYTSSTYDEFRGAIDFWQLINDRIPNNCSLDILELIVAEFQWRKRCLDDDLNPFINLLYLIRRTFPC